MTSRYQEHQPAPLALRGRTAVHVIGCGGAGMAPITALLSHMGVAVSGSDQRDSEVLRSLEGMGVEITVGDDYGAIPFDASIVRSTAIPDTHPEVAAALSDGRTVLRRADALAGITEKFRTVAVAGTHGKTTTSSMTAAALLGAGLDVSTVIGGRLIGPAQVVPGALLGAPGGLLIVEADESDGTFVELAAAIAVVTNVEPDHLEYYGGEDALFRAFDRFVSAPGVEVLVACVDDPGVRAMLERNGSGTAASITAQLITYGTDAAATVRLSYHPTGSSVRIGETDYPIHPGQPGIHNARNCAAAIGVVLAHAGGSTEDGEAPIAAACRALSDFGGVGRRFEVRGVTNGITVVDDYAHLSGEISAAITAARDVTAGRVIVAFQPHRFSRTEALWSTYAPALATADAVILTDIYSSGEAPRPGISSDLIATALSETYPDLPVDRVGAPYEVPSAIAARALPGDHCLLLSAGDLPSIADQTLARIADQADARLSRSVRSGIVRRAGDPGDVAATVAALVAELGEQVQVNGPIGQLCTYRVGGAAAALVRIETTADLEVVRREAREGVPFLVVGAGSNLLVADGGFEGVALQLSGSFAAVAIDRSGDTPRVSVGAAAMLPRVARQLTAEGLGGFEWAVGVPGTVGGAIRMNAGGHGSDMAASVQSVTVFNLRTGLRSMTAGALDFSYRHSSLDDDDIVLSADLALSAEQSSAHGPALLGEIVRWRRANQPGGQNAGSVFTNPPGDSAGRMIDSCGMKGFRIGTASVSTKHANFIQADPDGSADDVVAVIRAVQDQVEERYGVRLNVENHLVGFPPATVSSSASVPSGEVAPETRECTS